MTVYKGICALTIIIINIFSFGAIDKDRKWLEVTLEKKWSIDASDQLYRPGRGFHIDDEHKIYISDIGDRTIKMFNSEGNFVRSFGKEKGAGPGEIRHPIGFDVDDDGNLWIADPPNSRITIFQNDGSFKKHISLEAIPYRIAIQDEGDFLYIINRNASPDGKLTMLSDKGEVLKHYGSNIIEDQMRNSIVLSGEIAVGQEGNLYYSPDYAGLLLGFDSQGDELFKTKGVIPTPFPKVMHNAQGGSWVSREAERVSRGISVDKKGRVAVFSTASFRDDVQVLDFYDKNTGEYLNSMKLPEYTYQAYLKDSILYTLQYTTSDINLSAWEVVSEN